MREGIAFHGLFYGRLKFAAKRRNPTQHIVNPKWLNNWRRQTLCNTVKTCATR
jgi:hypothetical protein